MVAITERGPYGPACAGDAAMNSATEPDREDVNHPWHSLTLLRKHLGRTGLGGQRLIELTRMSAVKERVCRREVRLTLNERGGRRPSCSGCSAEVYQPSDFLVRATTKPRAKRRFV